MWTVISRISREPGSSTLGSSRLDGTPDLRYLEDGFQGTECLYRYKLNRIG